MTSTFTLHAVSCVRNIDGKKGPCSAETRPIQRYKIVYGQNLAML